MIVGITVADGSCSSPSTCVSSGYAYGIAVVFLLAAVLAIVAWRVWRRVRTAGSAGVVAAFGLLTGLSVAAVAVGCAGLMHYGPQSFGGQQNVVRDFDCSAWYFQMGPRDGLAEDGDERSPACRRAARDATGPAILVAAGLGVVLGGAATAVAGARRARFPRRLAALANPPG